MYWTYNGELSLFYQTTYTVVQYGEMMCQKSFQSADRGSFLSGQEPMNQSCRETVGQSFQQLVAQYCQEPSLENIVCVPVTSLVRSPRASLVKSPWTKPCLSFVNSQTCQAPTDQCSLWTSLVRSPLVAVSRIHWTVFLIVSNIVIAKITKVKIRFVWSALSIPFDAYIEHQKG